MIKDRLNYECETCKKKLETIDDYKECFDKNHDIHVSGLFIVKSGVEMASKEEAIVGNSAMFKIGFNEGQEMARKEFLDKTEKVIMDSFDNKADALLLVQNIRQSLANGEKTA